jgi:hypothetical protein
MNSKLKALGLALVAALALTAVMASAASAQFTSNKEHTIISGFQQEKNHVFSAGSGFYSISCSTILVNGTLIGTNDADLTITPTYETCKDTAGRTVDVDNSKLTYTFTRTGAVAGTPVGEIHVSGGITFTTTSGGSVVCTTVIKVPQSINGVTYHDNGSGIKVTTGASNVISTTSGGILNCGISNGEHTAGTYDGTTNMTGVNTSGVTADIDVD